MNEYRTTMITIWMAVVIAVPFAVYLVTKIVMK
jgi:hypothetical protein